LSVCTVQCSISVFSLTEKPDEFIYHATHDQTIDWLMPAVPPTGQKLSIPMMAVVNVRGDRLYNGMLIVSVLELERVT
jgi:hypothetical protein